MLTRGKSLVEKGGAQRPLSLTIVATTLSESTATPVLDTPTITNLVFNSLEGLHSGVPTRTTSTLTPTTLRNIEQSLGLSAVPPRETHHYQAGFVPPLIDLPTAGSNSFTSVDSKCWGGGVTTVAPSSTSSRSSSSSRSNSSPLPPIPTITASVNTSRRMGGRRPFRDERLSPEEENRKRQRRERNKEAAARCRKRRVDQTNTLQDETEQLEDKRTSLQEEMGLLQQQREELEFLLATHKASCRRVANRNSVGGGQSSAMKVMMREVKVEGASGGGAVYQPVQGRPSIRSSTNSTGQRPRPTTLTLMQPSTTRLNELGIPIETPTAGLRDLNFDSMMEGGTGLTPIGLGGMGLTPLTCTGLTPLSTPVVSIANCVTVTSSSYCGSQQRSGELASPDSGSRKLVSL